MDGKVAEGLVTRRVSDEVDGRSRWSCDGQVLGAVGPATVGAVGPATVRFGAVGPATVRFAKETFDRV